MKLYNKVVFKTCIQYVRKSWRILYPTIKSLYALRHVYSGLKENHYINRFGNHNEACFKILYIHQYITLANI